MRWGYTWQLDGKTVTRESDLKWRYGPSGVLDLYLRSKNGLPDGPYNLQMFLNDTLAQEGRFVVGERGSRVCPKSPRPMNAARG